MLNSEGKLRGRVAVITGGNRGLGFASAKRFVEEGARVALFSRDAERNAQAVRELEALGGEAIAIAGSVTCLDDISRLMSTVATRWGGIDVLFVNHGVIENVDFLEITEEIYDRVMDINAKGSFFAVQKAVPYLRGNASVILCTSSAIHLAVADQMHYTAAKHALDSFRRTMSKALVGRGIRINALCPGMMMTEMVTAIFENLGEEARAYAEELRDKYIPAGRAAQPEEVAEAAVFLASDDSRYMLGSEMVVDGGMSMVR